METRQSETPPAKVGEPGGPTGNTANINHVGATTISESKNEDFSDSSTVSYSSQTGGENALLITGGEVSIKAPEITKSGDESSENSDFYGK